MGLKHRDILLVKVVLLIYFVVVQGIGSRSISLLSLLRSGPRP